MLRHLIFGFGVLALGAGVYMRMEHMELYWLALGLGALAMVVHWFSGKNSK